MTVTDIMLRKYDDGIYKAAFERDRVALEEAKEQVANPEAFLPDIDLYGQDREDSAADILHKEITGVVIRHFVRQYIRDDMLTLLNLLLRIDQADKVSVQLCEGLTLSLSELCEYWNQEHPKDRPIEYVANRCEMP